MMHPPDILNAKILIVDDQEANIALLQQLLESAGYRSVTATQNPLEVRSLHHQHNYDLILLDLQMPVLDGFGVMAGLKVDLVETYLPVIVLTAQPAHKLQALLAGAKDFISKPFDVVEVKTRIFNMLEVRILYKRLEQYNEKLEQLVAERTAELQLSEMRYRGLTELASDWYWEQDDQGKFTQVSGPVFEMLGLSSELSSAEGWNEQEREKIQACIKARVPFLDLTFTRQLPDRPLQHFRVSGEPLFDQASRFTGYRGIGVECFNKN